MAIHSHKAVILYGAAGAETVTFAGVMGITPPELAITSIEVTDLDSANFAKEFMAGLVDGGEASLELRFKKAEMTAMFALVRQEKSWKIRFNDGSTGSNGSTLVFLGFLTKIGPPKAELDKDVTASVSIKATGLPVYTAGA